MADIYVVKHSHSELYNVFYFRLEEAEAALDVLKASTDVGWYGEEEIPYGQWQIVAMKAGKFFNGEVLGHEHAELYPQDFPALPKAKPYPDDPEPPYTSTRSDYTFVTFTKD